MAATSRRVPLRSALLFPNHFVFFGAFFSVYAHTTQIMAFLTQYNIKEDEVVEMKVPKHNSSSFNTGVAFLHMKDEEAVQKTIALKGTYIGER